MAGSVGKAALGLAIVVGLAGLVLAVAAPGCADDKCTRHSDCPHGLICSSDGVCELAPVDAGPPPDASLPDASTIDAGDAGDGGTADAGDSGAGDSGAADAGDGGVADAGDGGAADAAL
jgi:hypothetical protein